MRRGVTIVLAVAMCACNDSAINEVDTSMSGQWSYTVTDLTGAVNFTCSIQGAMISLMQSGGDLTGSVTGGTMSCQMPSGITVLPLSGGDITNSGIDGASVQINFGNPNLKNVGTVSGNAMSGVVEARGILGTTAQLTGKFSATRQ